MSADRKIELLEKVPLFSNCTSKELKRIASIAETVDAANGEVLTTEGQPGEEFFVIAEGSADVTLREDHLAALGEGDFFGEMALLDQAPRAATVTATGPMRCYVISQRDFGSLLEEVPVVARQILKELAQRLRNVEHAPQY